MNNKDKLICLFESEGFDVKEFKTQKKDSIMGNKERASYVFDKSGIVDSIKKDGQNYEELCHLEKAMKNAEEDIYGGYPTNPFIYDYKNHFLRGQRICDCMCKVDGESLSLEQVKNSRISAPTKDQIFRDEKRRWVLETKNYVSSRKSKELMYLEKNVFGNNWPLKFDGSYVLVLVQILFCVVLFLLRYTNIMEGYYSFIAENITYANDKLDVIKAAGSLFWILSINTLFEASILLLSKNRIIDKVSDKYNSLYDEIDRTVGKISIKTMSSSSLLGGFTNYVEKADKIDHKYRGGRKSQLCIWMDFLQSAIGVTGLVLFIIGCIEIKFWILLLFLIGLEIIRGLFKEGR